MKKITKNIQENSDTIARESKKGAFPAKQFSLLREALFAKPSLCLGEERIH